MPVFRCSGFQVPSGRACYLATTLLSATRFNAASGGMPIIGAIDDGEKVCACSRTVAATLGFATAACQHPLPERRSWAPRASTRLLYRSLAVELNSASRFNMSSKSGKMSTSKSLAPNVGLVLGSNFLADWSPKKTGTRLTLTVVNQRCLT